MESESSLNHLRLAAIGTTSGSSTPNFSSETEALAAPAVKYSDNDLPGWAREIESKVKADKRGQPWKAAVGDNADSAGLGYKPHYFKEDDKDLIALWEDAFQRKELQAGVEGKCRDSEQELDRHDRSESPESSGPPEKRPTVTG